MHEDVLAVIRAFQAEVAQAVALLELHLGTTDAAEQRELVRQHSGHLDVARLHRCAFHGEGCRVQLSSTRFVDWDYGHKGRTDGFDLWGLKNFLQSRRKLQRRLSVDQLSDAFARAAEAGVICSPWRDHHDRLFYVVQDLDAEGDV